MRGMSGSWSIRSHARSVSASRLPARCCSAPTWRTHWQAGRLLDRVLRDNNRQCQLLQAASALAQRATLPIVLWRTKRYVRDMDLCHRLALPSAAAC